MQESKPTGENIKFAYINPNGRKSIKDTEHRAFMRYLIIKNSPEYGNYIEVRQIFVNKEHRLKGYGKKFIEFLVRLGKKEGLDAIYVNTSALATEPFGCFMIKVGFKRICKETAPQDLPHFPFKKTLRKYAKRK